MRCVLALSLLCFGLVLFFAIVNPWGGVYKLSERARLGAVHAVWYDLEDMGAHIPRSVVAAEDANFCLHHGIDFDALADAIDEGATRGASTITQQVAKNLFLWHGRSYFRKGLEAGFALLIDTVWTKRRILEVYLNIAEFDEGVFGAGTAAGSYFGTTPDRIGPEWAGRLAAVLPDPQHRSASNPGPFVRKRGRAIANGAATIAADGRADCFEAVDQRFFSWQ
ncbi:MAG: monofunctional biosynthetic peptidoglycan transglycosylase [Pseudomonadota bacterium]